MISGIGEGATISLDSMMAGSPTSDSSEMRVIGGRGTTGVQASVAGPTQKVDMAIAEAWVDALYAYASASKESGKNTPAMARGRGSSVKRSEFNTNTSLSPLHLLRLSTSASTKSGAGSGGEFSAQEWLQVAHRGVLAQLAVGVSCPPGIGVNGDEQQQTGGGSSSPAALSKAHSSPLFPAASSSVPPCVLNCDVNLFLDLYPIVGGGGGANVNGGALASSPTSSALGGGGEVALQELSIPTRSFTKAIGRSTSELPLLLAMWFDGDTDCSGSISTDELTKLLSRLNVSLSSKAIDELVSKVDSSRNALIEFTEFIHMYQILTTNADVCVLFESLASNVTTNAYQRRKSAFGSTVALPGVGRKSSTRTAASSPSSSRPPLQSALSSAGFSSKTYAGTEGTNGRRLGMTKSDLIDFLVLVQGERGLDRPENSAELSLHLAAFGLHETSKGSPSLGRNSLLGINGASGRGVVATRERRVSSAFGEVVAEVGSYESDDDDEDDDNQPYIHLRQFQRALLNPFVNSWIHPRESAVHHDMSQPLTHYFIDSSHNTYLTGHQLVGGSSVDMYRRALLSGCRCLELDCYDGPSGDPVITHGNTFTTKIKFRDVIATINRFAFVASPYPVILSLENHTSLPQQATMVTIMKEIFGAKLTNAAMAESSSLKGYEFSPEGLKYKILLKAKRAWSNNSNLQGALAREDAEGHEQQARGGGNDDIVMGDDELSAAVSAGGGSAVLGSAGGGSNNKEHVFLDSKKISMELSEATYLAGVKFKSFTHAAVLPHYAISSVNESVVIDEWAKLLVLAVEKVAQHQGSTGISPGISPRWLAGGANGNAKSEEDLKRSAAVAMMYEAVKPITLALRFFLRVYPKGSRINSANMDPFPCWNTGCQMVAQNIQTPDEGNRMSRYRFRQNGRCGYLLKPLAMRRDGGMSLGFRDNATLSVRVVCGIALPRPNKKTSGGIVDPFVEVSIRGWGQDDSTAPCTVNPRRTTSVIQDNGFNPRWGKLLGSESFVLEDQCAANRNTAVEGGARGNAFNFTVQAVELGMLCFRVMDNDIMNGEFVGENCASLAAIREGFRCVPLYNQDGQLMPSPTCLLVHISWNGLDVHSRISSSTNATPPPRRIENTHFGIYTTPAGSQPTTPPSRPTPTTNDVHNNNNNKGRDTPSPSPSMTDSFGDESSKELANIMGPLSPLGDNTTPIRRPPRTSMMGSTPTPQNRVSPSPQSMSSRGSSASGFPLVGGNDDDALAITSQDFGSISGSLRVDSGGVGLQHQPSSGFPPSARLLKTRVGVTAGNKAMAGGSSLDSLDGVVPSFANSNTFTNARTATALNLDDL